MSVHWKVIDKKCPACGGQMEYVSIKNPFVDDFSEDCTSPGCELYHDGYMAIMRSARSRANEEAERDRNG